MRVSGLSFLVASAPNSYVFEGRTNFGEQVRIIISEAEARDIVTIASPVRSERRTATD